MTFYSVLAVTPTAEDWIPAYTASAGEIVSRHDGKYIARTPNHQQLEGRTAGSISQHFLIEGADALS